MIDFSKIRIRTPEEKKQERKLKYYESIDKYLVNPTINKSNLEKAIDHLSENFLGILQFDFGKYEGYNIFELYFIDKQYLLWYIENMKITKDCCIDLVKDVYEILEG